MRLEILTIGTELTLGLIQESNSSYIAQKLTHIGLVCTRKSSVFDDIDVISEAIKDALSRTDVLIITGGLGSTSDDVTREALAKALSKKLVYQPILAASLEQKLKCLKQPMPESVLKQAYLPEGAEPIKPSHGTAPGIIIRHRSKVVFVLPGVPSEMSRMFEEAVVPFLRKASDQRNAILLRKIRTCGEGELAIEEKIKEIVDRYPDLSITFIPKPGEVQLQCKTKGTPEQAKVILDEAEEEIKEVLGSLVYGVDEQTLEEVLGKLLKKHELKVVFVESCTGGALSHRLTNISGSSAYFWGTIVAYGNEAKKKLVGVSNEELLQHGAVSAPVALAMAEGGRHVAQVDIALSVTGVAGPLGETKEKPIGLVFMGLAGCEGSYCQRFQFTGTRDEIRIRATQSALNMLRLFLLEKFENIGSEVS